MSKVAVVKYVVDKQSVLEVADALIEVRGRSLHGRRRSRSRRRRKQVNDEEFMQRIERMKADGFQIPVRTEELVKMWQATAPTPTSKTLDRAVAAMIQVARAEQVIDKARDLFQRVHATGVLGVVRDPSDEDGDDTPADVFYGELHRLDHAIKDYDDAIGMRIEVVPNNLCRRGWHALCDIASSNCSCRCHAAERGVK